MAVLPILQHPDKRLREVSKPVEAVTPEVEQEIQSIIDTVKATPNSAGLAAPQVGIFKRIFIAPDLENKGEWLVYINPEILEKSEATTNMKEGCLSVPGGVYECIKRAEKITWRYMKPDGSIHTEEAEGWDAKCFQHEIDHLDGVLFIDHLSSLRRKMAEKKIDRYHRKNS